MKKPKQETTCYMTAGIKGKLLNHSKEIQNALNRFKAGDFGSSSQAPKNERIKEFGSYETSFGTMWVINYKLFRDRDFITVLLPDEYE